jgi:small-conductance mechanosensitive channel
MPETAQEISEKPEVRKELARTAGEKKPSERIKARATDKFWFVTHGLVLIGCAILYYLIGSRFVPLAQTEVDFSRRILRGFVLIVVILATAKAVRVYAIGQIEDAVTRFTLQRIQYLVVGVLIAAIAISVIFVNWYAALTALGIGSIIVGLAVRTPMKSFIAWIYILVRRPYSPVDELEVRGHPRVIFRVDEVTWIDAIVRYLVAPREAGSTKSRLIPKLLAALNVAPEKVMFPKGDAR